jgi:hypothetical protein
LPLLFVFISIKKSRNRLWKSLKFLVILYSAVLITSPRIVPIR